MTDKLPNDDSDKGFAAFSRLVSDVSKDIESVAHMTPSTPTTQLGAPITPSNSSKQSSLQSETPQNLSPTMSPARARGGLDMKLFWGVMICVVIAVVIGNSGKKESLPYTPTASNEPAPALIHDPIPPTKEGMPPIGVGLVLNQEQIRYCLSEDIRLEAAKGAVNNYIESDVENFNAMIADYNSRCGNFRYRSGALESVRSEVEPNRGKLQLEGSIRFLHLRR